MVPEDLRYTDQHEWVRATGDTARVGITDFAQDQLGDIVFVQLPEVGAQVKAGETMGEVESTKSVSDLYAPVTGTVAAINDALADAPETINSAPYEAGWLIEITLDDPAAPGALLDAEAYKGLIAS